ncbi:Non-specific serine/threonine protein kinase [Sulfidibacter corallicola]
MFQTNTQISKYVIIEEIGDGGMGVVYKARDVELDRVVALKCFKPFFDIDDTGRDRFFLEAKATSKLDHPNICTLYGVEEADNGQIFMVMSYYSGGTLSHKMEQGKMPLDQVLTIAAQMASGLGFAHEHQIIHRDIKPGNIMFDGLGIVKIVDFGIAKLLDHPPLTNPGTVLGTMAYMPPEQAEGEPVNHQADIWSFGVVLYEMLCGKQPFEGKTEQQIYEAILMETPTPCFRLNSEVPKPLSAIVDRSLEKSLEDRYNSFSQVLSDLEAFRTGESPDPDDDQDPNPPLPSENRHLFGWFSNLRDRMRR